MAIGIAGPPAAAADLAKRLRAMTPADVSAAVTLHDDRAAGSVTVSTEAAFVRSPLSPIRHLLSDNHLRAVIDPQTATVTYEVHQSIFHWGEPRTFVAARFPAGGGARTVGLIRADAGERFCPNEDGWGHCALTRQIAFPIAESDIRSIAARYRPGGGDGWAYRIEESGGRHWDDRISPAEAAGLLLAVDQVRTKG
ncbi:MAG: hypothetical protein V4618_05740 [Pseudomonadota bacterium]